MSSFLNRLKSIKIALLLVLSLAFSIVTASAQGLDAIFTRQSNGEIDNILTTTGASNTLYTATGHYWNGAAFDQTSRLLYISDIGQNSFTPGTNITNTIYSFNPANPSGGVTEVGTITGQSAFTGAGFHNGLYYAIGTGSNQLVSYNFAGHSGAGAITSNSTQTLGGLGGGVTGLSLGDLDFVGNTIYISSGTVSGGTTVSTSYTLYKYTDVSNTTTPILSVTEPKVGVGIANDIPNGTVIIFNSDGTISNVNQTTGAQTGSVTLTGPASVGGAGDFTIVPEPSAYAAWALVLLFGLVALHRVAGNRRPAPALALAI